MFLRDKKVEMIWQAISVISQITRKMGMNITMGLSGKKWLTSLTICILLLPTFSSPANATVLVRTNTNSEEFEPVNENLWIWDSLKRDLNAKVGEWTTPMRRANMLYDKEEKKAKEAKIIKEKESDNDKKKGVKRKGKKGLKAKQNSDESQEKSDDNEEDEPDESEEFKTSDGKENDESETEDSTEEIDLIESESANDESIIIETEENAANSTLTYGGNQRSDEEIESLFTTENNLGRPFGQVEAQPENPPVALGRGRLERPGSSNFSFTLPVSGLIGRGIDTNVSLSYNSRVWSVLNSPLGTFYGYNTDRNWVSPGFTLSQGKLERLNYYTFSYTSPDGTRHQLHYVSGDNYARTYESYDGTFMKLDITSSTGVNTTSAVLKKSDGSVLNFAIPNVNNKNFYPSKITDSNGNFIELTYLSSNTEDGRLSTIKDTLGRLIKFYYDSSFRIVTITVPGYNNSAERQTIRFYYETKSFPQVDRFADRPDAMPQSIDLLKYVYFPGTQAGYKYEYSAGYGMIHKVTDLRGMQVNSTSLTTTGIVTAEGQIGSSTEYNYPLAVGTPLSGVPQYTTRTDDWAGKTASQSAVTTYQVEKDTTNNRIISQVTSPNGTVTETWANTSSGWDSGLVTDVFIKTLTNPQFQIYKTWSHKKSFWQNQTGTDGRQNPRIVKLEQTNEAAETRATTIEYDLYNNETKITEYDFAPAGQLGPELERAEITYENGSGWLNNRVYGLPKIAKKIVNNVTVSRTDFEYDNYGSNETEMIARNDIIMFDQKYNPSSAFYNSNTKYRGNITNVTSYSDATLSNDPNASVTEVEYDIAGNKVESTANCCVKFAWGYNKATEYAYQVSQSKGLNSELTTNVTYDLNTGLVKSSSNENNQVTTVTYDANSLRQTRVDNPNSGYTTYEYNDNLVSGPNGLKWSYIKSTVKVDANKEVTNWNYLNGQGSVVRKLGPSINGVYQGVTDVEYDVMGRVSKVSNPFKATSYTSPINPSNNWTTSTFDPLRRVTQLESPDGTKTLTNYDGRTVIVTDQAGKKRRQFLDALGNITRLDEPDENGNLGTVSNPNQPTYYEYDGNDNLSKVTQSSSGINQERLFKFDSLNRLTHEKQVESDPTLSSNGDKVSSGGLWTGVHKYNASGLMIETNDARGVKSSLDYDTLNRITSVSHSGETGVTTPDITYTYDEVQSGSFNIGQVTKVTTSQVGNDIPATEHTFNYDEMGKIKKQTQKVATNTYSMEYGYNLIGQLISEKYPSGRTVALEIDDIGRPMSITDANRTYNSGFQFSSHGAISSVNFGNGTTQTFDYDQERLQLTSQSVINGTDIIQKFEYGYGQVDLSTGNLDSSKNNGKIARIDSYIGGSVNNPEKQWQQRFDYDELGRLQEVREHRGDTNSLSYKSKFDYDRFGNLYRKQSSNPTTGQDTPIAFEPIEEADIDKSTNRFTSSAGVSYNESGQVISDNKFRTLNYNYDANGRMIKAVQASVPDALSVYDGFGNRVATKVNNVWEVSVYDAFGKEVAKYGGMQSTDEGGVRYIFKDWQGSTRAILDQNANVRERSDYQAFGEEIQSGTGHRDSTQGYGGLGNLANKYALTERDKATGLDHTWFRKLENRSGKWTSSDPYKGSMSIFDPQSFNRYSYVTNDPINNIDPSGLDSICTLTTVSYIRQGHEYREYLDILSCNEIPTRAGGASGGGPSRGGGPGGGSTRVFTPKENFKECVEKQAKKALDRFEEDVIELVGETVAVAGFTILAAVLVAAIFDPEPMTKAILGIAAGIAVVAIITAIFAHDGLRKSLERAVEDAIENCKDKPGAPENIPSVSTILDRIKNGKKKKK